MGGPYLADSLPARWVKDEVGAPLVCGSFDERLRLRDAGEPHLVLFVEKPAPIRPDARTHTSSMVRLVSPRLGCYALGTRGHKSTARNALDHRAQKPCFSRSPITSGSGTLNHY